MICQLQSGVITQLSSPCLIVPIFSAPHPLTPTAQILDTASQSLISQLRTRGDFKAKAEETLVLHQVPGIQAERILLVGCGAVEKFDGLVYQNIIFAATKALANTAALTATFCIQDLPVKNREVSWNLRHAAMNALQQIYQFNQFKSESEKTPKTSTIEQFFFHVDQANKTCEQALQEGQAIAEGMSFARDLGNLPPNICHPIYLAETAAQLAKQFPHVSCESLDEAALKKLGAGAFLAVSQGSEQEGRLIIVKYQGAPAEQQPYVIVGKGITFDTGGISLKPGAEMDEMKFDMCGAATVLGTLRAVAQLQLPINLIAIVAAAENMPSGHAARPGDIVKSLSGKTIEILNTDAEGRLVLCDALTYSLRFNPLRVIDVATLTGACVIALGNHAAGLLSNHDALAQDLLAAGEQANDRAWQLPLWDDYKKQLESPFADMANIGGRPGGTITAACFLSEFTHTMAWAHLDIAGVAWKSGGKEKGATGRPVPLLTHYLIQQAAQAPAAR